MKTKTNIFSVISTLAVLSFSSVFAVDFDYAIKKYDVTLNFSENNSVNTSETIQANFYKSRNGISRKLDLNYTKDDKVLTRKIKDVETNDIHVLTRDENNEIIKIADIKKRTESQKEYNLVYNSQYDGKLYSKDFTFDLVDGSWNRTVENVNFKLTFPKKMKYKKIEFISSVSGIVDENLVEYSVNKNVIEGRYLGALFPNEKFCVHIMADKKSLHKQKNNQLILNNVKNQDISVYEGDEILVRLNSNPTTGFVWQLSVDSDEPDTIELSESNFISSNKNLCGAPGITEYTIKALKPGKAVVSGVYVRPWMKNENVSKNAIEYTINVIPLK